jgi:hypothetical protein
MRNSIVVYTFYTYCSYIDLGEVHCVAVQIPTRKDRDVIVDGRGIKETEKLYWVVPSIRV